MSGWLEACCLKAFTSNIFLYTVKSFAIMKNAVARIFIGSWLLASKNHKTQFYSLVTLISWCYRLWVQVSSLRHTCLCHWLQFIHWFDCLFVNLDGTWTKQLYNLFVQCNIKKNKKNISSKKLLATIWFAHILNISKPWLMLALR